MALGLLASWLTACAVPNPQYISPVATPSTPQYIPYDLTTVSNAVAIAKQIDAVSAPVNPYAGLINTGLDWALGIAATVAGAIAAYKNKQNNTNVAAADTLAATVVKAGPAIVASALTQAAKDGSTAVQTHIQNNS